MSEPPLVIAAIDADAPGADGLSLMDRFARLAEAHDEEHPHAAFVAWLARTAPGLHAYATSVSRHHRVPWTVLVGLPVLELSEHIAVAEAEATLSEARIRLAALGHHAEPSLWLAAAADERDLEDG